MKKFAVILAVASLVLNSCGTQRLSTSTDDVYVSPAEEKKKREIAAAEKAKEEMLARQKAEEARKAENERIASNPYYKEPEYTAEDYYDYEYASRINRFCNPIGVSYYDSYYTNMYTYNQNPSYYGTSIYSSLGSGMPYANQGSMTFGFSSGYNNCGGCGPFVHTPSYDPWYSPYGYQPNYGAFGYPYSSYMSGYSAGFYSGFYSGVNAGYWPYYNSYDVNSGYGRINAGPRVSNGGNNVPTRDGNSGKVRETPTSQSNYFETVSEQQRSSPRFNTVPDQRVRGSGNNGIKIDGQRGAEVPGQTNDQRARESNGTRGNDRINQKQAEPPRNDNVLRRADPVQNNSTPGGTAPRNSGNTGTNRPR